MICVLSGGVGAAKFLRGLRGSHADQHIVAIVNTGDDDRFHALAVSPDIDTVTYTLAGLSNDTLGWGVKDETFKAMGELSALGGDSWFSLGDRDLGTHLYRTDRLNENATLAQVTAEIASKRDLGIEILPMSNDPVRTRIVVSHDGSTSEVSFQEYFVKDKHQGKVVEVSYRGAENAAPAPGVLDSILEAEVVIIAPSNPILSIKPILAIGEIAEAVAKRRSSTVFISPIVGGKAIKGPAESNLKDLLGDSSLASLCRIYTNFASGVVVDEGDFEAISELGELGYRVLLTDTMMTTRAKEENLAKATVEFARALAMETPR